MRVLITGGCGYVGQWLARLLLERGELSTAAGPQQIAEIVLYDLVAPAQLLPGLTGNVVIEHGDLGAGELPAKQFDSVFHLASIVSGEGEVDFDKALRVNLDGQRSLLEQQRQTSPGSRFVFASTIAVFGPISQADAQVGDCSKQVPTTTYGVTKVIGEQLVNDYSRKGFIDGRSARLPTVIVRAGKPNLAASSFCSGVLREPLAGTDAVLPVPRSQPMPITSYRAVVAGLIAVHELPAKRLGNDRAVGLPALNVTAGDLADCCVRLQAQRLGMGKVIEQIDPTIAEICAGWPIAIDNSRATELGLPFPPDLDEIAAQYIADFVDS